TCDMLVAPTIEVKEKLIKGICGQVPGSIIPGMTGMEAGQSAFGDAYAWFRDVLTWPLQNILTNSSVVDAATAKALVAEITGKLIPELSREAAKLPEAEKNELAVDWF